jgi:hypothetical protein
MHYYFYLALSSKSRVLPTITHMLFLPTQRVTPLTELNIFNFVRNGKMDTITRVVLMKSYEEGSLIMVDLNNYIKLTWQGRNIGKKYNWGIFADNYNVTYVIIIILCIMPLACICVLCQPASLSNWQFMLSFHMHGRHVISGITDYLCNTKAKCYV